MSNVYHFQLQSTPLQPDVLTAELTSRAAGAFASFTGLVRDFNDNKAVTGITYEASPTLSQREGLLILQEAADRFSILGCCAAHRTGELSLGDLAVWIGVTAVHRDAAFRACRYIIEEIKVRLPIWKKEHYASDASAWLAGSPKEDPETSRCGQHPVLTEPEQAYYARQVILPELGLEGQTRLKDARVIVVGAGGLGCTVLTSLAQAGVGSIGICEYDRVEASNLHRQMLYTYADIGQSKLPIATRRVRDMNPFVTVVPHDVKLDAANAERVLAGYNLIIDATDNFPTKFLLNDAAVLLDKILIQASIYQWEGELRMVAPRRRTGCLRCLWPSLPPADAAGSCIQNGVLGMVPGLMGHLQAIEAIKVLLGLPDVLAGTSLLVNCLTHRTRTIRQSPSPSCPVCSRRPVITRLRTENYLRENQWADYEIDLGGIPESQWSHYRFVDVRESNERELFPLAHISATHLPASRFAKWNFHFDKDEQYLLFCSAGMRSRKIVKALHEQGITNTRSVAAGLAAIQSSEY